MKNIITFTLDDSIYKGIQKELEQNAELFIRQYTSITGVNNDSAPLTQVTVEARTMKFLATGIASGNKAAQTQVAVSFEQEPVGEAYVWDTTLTGSTVRIGVPDSVVSTERKNFISFEQVKAKDFPSSKIFLPKV